jgi:hypothetical protein
MWITPNLTEKTICGLTALSFLLLLLSHYTVGVLQHTLTIATGVSWIVATLLVFTLHGNVVKVA